MIRFRLTGGLGNQLFTYSAGLYFSAVTGQTVCFDLTDRYLEKSRHKSDIRNLNAPGNFDNSIISILKTLIFNFAFHRLKIRSLFKKLYRSEVIGLDPKLKDISGFRQVAGYFQSYSYTVHEKVIEQLNQFKITNPSKEFESLEKELLTEPVLGVHIRRGDYLKNSETIGVLDLNYYVNSVKLIMSEKYNDLPFSKIFIFTDSPEIFSEFAHSLQLTTPIQLISNSNLTDEEELMLMSKLDYLIISNSTFSWWGARLGNQNKFVVAPQKWFRGIEDPENIVPSNWEKVESTWIN